MLVYASGRRLFVFLFYRFTENQNEIEMMVSKSAMESVTDISNEKSKVWLTWFVFFTPLYCGEWETRNERILCDLFFYYFIRNGPIFWRQKLQAVNEKT